MNPPIARFIDGEKFMWDGEVYDAREAAEAKKREYEAAQFETDIVEAEGGYLVYSRRVVKEVVVEGTPPV
ncbi:MAG: hypothetical protein AMS25_09455 [Gemmatimonas sp. SM23_52]|nr:MAG: hypothetical protein AMS25_09455 [Gemmatimonas sp. SM23_52]